MYTGLWTVHAWFKKKTTIVSVYENGILETLNVTIQSVFQNQVTYEILWLALLLCILLPKASYMSSGQLH